MCNQHHQVGRRIQGMQHSLKWMQCRHSWSIPDHCPEITTVTIQVKKWRNTLLISRQLQPEHCVSIIQGNAFHPTNLHGNFDIDKDHVSSGIRILTSRTCYIIPMTKFGTWWQKTTADNLSTLINPWCMITRISNNLVISWLISLMCRIDLHQPATNPSTSNH